MVPLYDPADRKDLARIERKLGAAGIEFTVIPARRGGLLPGSIGVAEEDLPRAEEVLGLRPEPSIRH